MSSDPPLPMEERRRASRFVKDGDTDFAIIVQPGGVPTLAEVHDESLGGLGLYLVPDQSWSVDQQVLIVYAGSQMDSTIRHIQALPDGRLLVGFECTPPAGV